MPIALLLTAHDQQGNVIDWWIKTELFWMGLNLETKNQELIYKECIGILFAEISLKILLPSITLVV